MSIRDWFSGLLGCAPHEEGASDEDVRQALARVVGIVPQVRLASRYEARLGPAIRATLQYGRDLVAALPAARDATPATWATDPLIRAMFATPEDIPHVLGKSHELRAWLDEHFTVTHVYAVLGSQLMERSVLRSAHEDGITRADVPRTAVSFEDRRIRIFGDADASLREEIVHRLVEQLALEALARIEATETRRGELEEARALLRARMQMLERRGAGMSGLFGASGGAANSASPAETAKLAAEFSRNEAALEQLGSRAEAIEQQLDTLLAIFADPSALVQVTPRTLRLTQMNLVVEPGSDEQGADVQFHLARIPMQPPQTRAFVLVRIARDDMPPAGSVLDDAAHLLL